MKKDETANNVQKEVSRPEPRGTQPPQLIIDRISQIYERPVIACMVITSIGLIGDSIFLSEKRKRRMKGSYIGIVFYKWSIIQNKPSRKCGEVDKYNKNRHNNIRPKP